MTLREGIKKGEHVYHKLSDGTPSPHAPKKRYREVVDPYLLNQTDAELNIYRNTRSKIMEP
jgi:hypothetical protein